MAIFWLDMMAGDCAFAQLRGMWEYGKDESRQKKKRKYLFLSPLVSYTKKNQEPMSSVAEGKEKKCWRGSSAGPVVGC